KLFIPKQNFSMPLFKINIDIYNDERLVNSQSICFSDCPLYHHKYINGKNVISYISDCVDFSSSLTMRDSTDVFAGFFINIKANGHFNTKYNKTLEIIFIK